MSHFYSAAIVSNGYNASEALEEYKNYLFERV